MERCVITFSFIQQVFLEDLLRAKYSAGPWRHRDKLDRRGLPSQELQMTVYKDSLKWAHN